MVEVRRWHDLLLLLICFDTGVKVVCLEQQSIINIEILKITLRIGYHDVLFIIYEFEGVLLSLCCSALPLFFI